MVSIKARKGTVFLFSYFIAYLPVFDFNVFYLYPIIEHRTFASLLYRWSEQTSPHEPSLYTCTLSDTFRTLIPSTTRKPSKHFILSQRDYLYYKYE